MTTISSRLKRHQAGQHASSAVSIARATAKEQQRSLKSPPDTRAHDGIQMLLMYRKEVEKRLSLDPTYYTKST
uniref:Uncharacterized protein n=1 Tax=Globisporangium ultimum (strain ATCC 200006 / CBS 805.95 / DAOM BR144) TaxID=431595 RepID=K3WLD4_GLOUD